MQEVDLYNLTFLVELIVIFGLVYQELGIKPLITDMKNRLNEILKNKNIETIEKPSNDSLNIPYLNLQNKYNNLYALLMAKKDVDCSSQPIWSDNEAFTCRVFKNLIASNLASKIITYIMIFSVVFYLSLSLLSPIVSVKVLIVELVSKNVVYYTILVFLILCLAFISFCIYKFKEIKEKLFNNNGKIKELELEYFKEYDSYLTLKKIVINDEMDKATKDTEVTKDT